MTSPVERAIELRQRWSQRSDRTDARWPDDLWAESVSAEITAWTVPPEYGGTTLSPEQHCEACLELGRGDLLLAFILSQFQAGCQRIAAAKNDEVRRRWLPPLARGDCFGTVGISHLTTSRQHTATPAVIAEPHGSGFRLTGEVPWVTGARRAEVVVVGGASGDGSQVLAAVPTNRAGVSCATPLPLLALSGSDTGPVHLDHVEIGAGDLIAGPVPNVLQAIGTGGAGSLTTSALAVGHAFACLDRLAMEAATRSALEPSHTVLLLRAEDLRTHLLLAARGQDEPAHTPEQLRARATDLALKASQAFLTASKGAGFVAGHPAERLAREAMFFLVWSCPQAVAGQLLEGFSQCYLP